jgi:cation:H+ antiporter
MDFVIFTLAMGALIVGADFIVNHSENLAVRLNIPQFIIGATLVAFGTSFPEMATTVMANFNGKPDIAISNVIGSNIFNILLVLAMIFFISKKIKLSRDFFIKDASWVLVALMLFILMSIDGYIGQRDSVLLIFTMFGYILFLLRESYGLKIKMVNKLESDKKYSLIRNILLLILGFFLIISGAHFTVESAAAIAHSFNISEWIIGIILISFGTSLPELAVSISAVVKGKADMAIGNIIGSNLANTTIVLGSAGLIKDIPISLIDNVFDISTMVVATIMLVWITASRLYIRPIGVSLLILLTLFISETVDKIRGF